MTINSSDPRWAEMEKIGMAALDEFMDTFNSGDPLRWARTLQYPHIRLAGDGAQIWDTPEDYAKDNNVGQLRDAAGWGYSKWDWRKLIQADEDKLHIAVQFSRYTSDHKKIASYESFYIITKVNGRWGTKFRSSYAGVATGNSAF